MSSSGGLSGNAGQNTWMSHLANTTPLNQINLPGIYRAQYAETGPLQLLNHGFRFFHLILTSDGSYKNFIRDIAAFLSSNPSETVIVQIKHEIGSKVQADQDRDREWQQVFTGALTQQPDIRGSVFVTDGQPAYNLTLAQTRGKMILLADSDMQLAFAFDSPFVYDTATFWPVNFETKITTTTEDNNSSLWNKVNSSLQLALSRGKLPAADGIISTGFVQEIFFQTWLATESACGNADVAKYLAGGLKQLLDHGADALDGPKSGLVLRVGLVVFDNLALDQGLVDALIRANKTV